MYLCTVHSYTCPKYINMAHDTLLTRTCDGLVTKQISWSLNWFIFNPDYLFLIQLTNSNKVLIHYLTDFSCIPWFSLSNTWSQCHLGHNLLLNLFTYCFLVNVGYSTVPLSDPPSMLCNEGFLCKLKFITQKNHRSPVWFTRAAPPMLLLLPYGIRVWLWQVQSWHERLSFLWLPFLSIQDCCGTGVWLPQVHSWCERGQGLYQRLSWWVQGLQLDN